MFNRQPPQNNHTLWQDIKLEEEKRAFREKFKYRLMDSGTDSLYDFKDLNPNDHYLDELLDINRLQIIKQDQDNAFSATSPPNNTELVTEDCIEPARIVGTDRMLQLPINRISPVTVISGLSGATKTTLAMIVAILLVLSGQLVVVWDIKNTWGQLLDFAPLAGRIVYTKINDIAQAISQPPPNCSVHEWTNRFVNVIAQAYGRISAQRLLREIIDKLLAVMPKGLWPTIMMMIEALKTYKAKDYREREYVSSLLWTLVDMVNHFPGVFSYTYSDWLEKMSGTGGKLFIIPDNGLPVQHWNFRISLFSEWLIAFRLNNPLARNFNIFQLIEDSTSSIDPGQDFLTPGNVSMIAQQANIIRELKIGYLLVTHGLSPISRKILINVENYFCCSLRGDDLRLAQQVLGIDERQAKFLRTSPRGTACALVPSFWPHPVLVEYPNIMERINGK